jgi:hypothetical protein
MNRDNQRQRQPDVNCPITSLEGQPCESEAASECRRVMKKASPEQSVFGEYPDVD